MKNFRHIGSLLVSILLLAGLYGSPNATLSNRTMMGAAGAVGIAKIGSGCAAFLNSPNDYLTIDDHADWILGGGAGDFAVETWVYLLTDTIYSVFSQFIDTNNTVYWYYEASTDQLYFRARVGGDYILDCNISLAAHDGVWTNLAVDRSSGTLRIFVGGVSQAINYSTGDGSEAMPDLATTMRIANRDSLGYAGYMDEFRLSDTSRHTTNYTPSTTEFTSDGNTLLLLHFDTAGSSTFTDSGNTNHTANITAVGAATQVK